MNEGIERWSEERERERDYRKIFLLDVCSLDAQPAVALVCRFTRALNCSLRSFFALRVVLQSERLLTLINIKKKKKKIPQSKIFDPNILEKKVREKLLSKSSYYRNK